MSITNTGLLLSEHAYDIVHRGPHAEYSNKAEFPNKNFKIGLM